MKKFKLILTASLMILCFSAISYGYSNSITGKNDITMTNERHYPVLSITNHKDKDINVEWGAYGDKYQGSIVVPANSTATLELPELAFLGNNKDTTTVWLTWADENKLKPSGVDITTIPFEKLIDIPDVPQEELG